MKERSFRYGENSRGLGIITLPTNIKIAPVVVMLNAGLLYRAEPYRLNVLVSRRLAEAGYICLRVDISGKGDTPSRKGLTNRESVALDWSYIKKALNHQFGERNIIIMGLCSGADNGIKLAAQDESVKGLILLDAVSKRDQGFKRRALLNKISNVSKWLRLPKIVIGRIYKSVKADVGNAKSLIALRDQPNEQDLTQCFSNLVSAGGRVLAVFTGQAIYNYNQKGQFCRALKIPGVNEICEEIFWPHADHLYPVQIHRDQLILTICEWGIKHFDRFCTKESL